MTTWLRSDVILETTPYTVLQHSGWVGTTLYKLLTAEERHAGQTTQSTVELARLDPGGDWQTIISTGWIPPPLAEELISNIRQADNPEDGVVVFLL